MFDAADMDNDGLLSYGELAFAMQKASKEYSHLEEYSRYLDRCFVHAINYQSCDSTCATPWLACIVMFLRYLFAASSTGGMSMIGVGLWFMLSFVCSKPTSWCLNDWCWCCCAASRTVGALGAWCEGL